MYVHIDEDRINGVNKTIEAALGLGPSMGSGDLAKSDYLQPFCFSLCSIFWQDLVLMTKLFLWVLTKISTSNKTNDPTVSTVSFAFKDAA